MELNEVESVINQCEDVEGSIVVTATENDDIIGAFVQPKIEKSVVDNTAEINDIKNKNKSFNQDSNLFEANVLDFADWLHASNETAIYDMLATFYKVEIFTDRNTWYPIKEIFNSLKVHEYYEPLIRRWLKALETEGYVVKNEYAESLICALSGVDFMGRWMPEAQSNSAMYNKEYYWSDAHTFFNNPYYCGLEWVNIDSDHLNCVFPEKVLIPVKQYYSERKGELNSLNSEIASIYWHKPCEEMYTKLQLKYLKGSNSAFVDGAGELVCFESSELIGNDTGFYIRYDKLLEFLKSSSYTLVWTSLCEKRILTPSFGRWDLPPKAIHMSSVYYLKDGKIAKASETLFEDRLYY